MINGFLYLLLIMNIGAFVPMVFYALRKADDFQTKVFFASNKKRLLIGEIAIVVIALLMILAPDTMQWISAFMAYVGISVSASSASLVGAAIGQLLVSLIPSKPINVSEGGGPA